MKLTARQVNRFNMFKLPAAYFTGVRAKSLDDNQCTVQVRHKWINQNPFRSMFWAVQGMAAELTTGALVMGKIHDSGKSVSMLVLNNRAEFRKKATGKITFICDEGNKIDDALKQTIETGEGQTVWLNAYGTNQDGVVVSNFDFEWTLKLKSKK
ncbi:MAG: DUF4442 domain-containing protein [Bacteroidia bacterium]|nr:DUF4442 domain-containing protein [Bacteroidia bacterium]